jgi:hypothetical protein
MTGSSRSYFYSRTLKRRQRTFPRATAVGAAQRRRRQGSGSLYRDLQTLRVAWFGCGILEVVMAFKLAIDDDGGFRERGQVGRS